MQKGSGAVLGAADWAGNRGVLLHKASSAQSEIIGGGVLVGARPCALYAARNHLRFYVFLGWEQGCAAEARYAGRKEHNNWWRDLGQCCTKHAVHFQQGTGKEMGLCCTGLAAQKN